MNSEPDIDVTSLRGFDPAQRQIIYPRFRRTVTLDDNPHILIVSLDRICETLRNWDAWEPNLVERGEETWKPAKYEIVVWELNRGYQFYIPWFFVDHGKVALMDGRHRLYAFIDSNYTHTPVVVDQKDVAEVEAALMG